VLPIYRAAFLVDMGKGNGERSPSTLQLFETDMAGVMGSASHPL
jgi:hypothetical protein